MRRRARSAPADLRPEDVEAVFREFLARPASAGDVESWMRSGSLRALLDGVLGSQEYERRLAARRAALEAPPAGPFVNCWMPGYERYARPPGEVSPDGVAIVGGEGHLFIYGGSNDNVAAFRGETALADGWQQSWQALIERRVADARAGGRQVAFVVVPEKLAVYGDLFPGGLDARAPRPVQRLLEQAGLPLVYPEQQLRAAREGGETYLRTDSHLTVRGNAIVAAATLRALGADPALLERIDDRRNHYLAAGDLGAHFEPPVVEPMASLAAPTAQIVADNWEQIRAAGGHVGTARVFRNGEAPDERTLVVFGDSYGFGEDSYQGLSWFLSQVFREVHFLWVPFGWDPDCLERAGADLVVCQTAERFIARVPSDSVDVQELARETIGGRLAQTEERMFSDRQGAG